jgi:hypothetical protein
MARHVTEIIVAGEHCQVMTDAQLGEDSVDGSDLNTGAPASIPEISSFDVVLPFRRDQRDRRKSAQQCLAIPRTGETLQQFLQDEAGRIDGLAFFQGSDKGGYLGGYDGPVAPEGQRPDAGIHEQAQSRSRSAL